MYGFFFVVRLPLKYCSVAGSGKTVSNLSHLRQELKPKPLAPLPDQVSVNFMNIFLSLDSQKRTVLLHFTRLFYILSINRS